MPHDFKGIGYGSFPTISGPSTSSETSSLFKDVKTKHNRREIDMKIKKFVISFNLLIRLSWFRSNQDNDKAS